MKQQITWRETGVDSVNGYGIEVNYLFTSFDKDEIDYLKKWCEAQIGDMLVDEHITGFTLSTKEVSEK